MRKSIVVLGLLLAACGTKTQVDSTTPAPESTQALQKCVDRTPPAPAKEATLGKTKPVVTIPNGAPPCKLVIQDITVGTGTAAKAGDMITVQYVGVSWSTRQQFDASWDHGGATPLSLAQVIQGWQKGIPGMKVGGRRRLIIPADLGYGASGGNGIAPGETLVFVIDLLKVGV